MSADRLREAAKVLRERATAATPGPWQGRDGASWAAQVCVLDGDGHPVAATSMTESVPSALSDATYIATMHPGVGLALAEWLNQAALHTDEPNPLTNRAVQIADLILGVDL